MDNNLAQIFGSDTLPKEVLETLQEAFDAKVAEAEARIRDEKEQEIREELAARYAHDKANLVEAMDRMLTDVVKVTETKKAVEVAKLTETRKKLERSLKESKNVYKSKLTEHVAVSNRFVVNELSKVIKSLSEQKRALAEKHSLLETAFKKVKKTMAEQQQARFTKIDEFVMRQVSRELNEFEQDHRALVETRVKLVKESKAKLKETQKAFVVESAKNVERAIHANLKREMTQLHEDLERNRQNMFGRRIFEAMSAEFMGSYLNQGTEVSKLQEILESKNQELAQIKTKLNETQKAAETAGRKEKLAEDRAARTKVLGELLGGLKGDKKNLMSTMLESVKTEKLRDTFGKCLPYVLENNGRASNGRSTEVRPASRRIVEVHGDKPARIVESVTPEPDFEINAEMAAIVRLAGITK